MSEITVQIPQQNFELVRDQIAAILATELANQDYVNSIGFKKVWTERFIPLDLTHLPAINVVFDDVDYDNHDQKSRHGEHRFFIDITCNSQSINGDNGDKQSSLKAQRIGGIVMYILSSPEYVTLGFAPGLIQSRWVENGKIGNLSGNDGLHTSTFRVSFKVRFNETVGDIQGVAGKIVATTAKIEDTEEGFFYIIDNT